MIVVKPFARIMVGYDGSAAADAALSQAVALAEQYRGEVVAVHVSDLPAAAVLPIGTAAPAPGIDPVPVLRSLEPDRHDLYYELSARVASCSVPVSMEFSVNAAAAAGILDAALRWNATAIAVGTHARTGVAHALIGSVAEAVLRSAPVPVIVTREGAARESVARIVVGIDASEPSTNALDFAVGLGLEQRLRILYCTVADSGSIMRRGADPSFDPTPMLSVMRASARNALDAALQSANGAGLHPDTELTDAIDAGSGLCAVAGRHDADAIVIGNHQRGKLERFFLGSTAEAVIRHADRPVIVVPAHPKNTWAAAARLPSHV
ncbi:MAG: hypothetical protein QOI11_2153 [Candidatus Eremiobacteraeota bacterium]|nr:hypothetical protein [Candidatus Eremiobacteraeota bacterium]